MINARGGGGGYSPKIPIRVCAAQRGRDFGTPYGYNISNTRKLQIISSHLLFIQTSKTCQGKTCYRKLALESYAILERGIKN